MKCGIIGPPNVGKSSLFNSLIKKNMASVANYAFCTIDPNVASVPYNDERLDIIHKITGSKKIVPSYLSFVDIAGIVKEAASNIGLGNKFLSTMASVDVIIQVVRCFSEDYIGGEGEIQGDTDPLNDMEYVMLELILWDLRMWKTYCDRDKKNIEINKLLLNWLQDEKPVREFLKTLDAKTLEYYQNALKNTSMITDKPMIIAANISNKSVDQENIKKVAEKCQQLGLPMVVVCGNYYHSTINLSPEEQAEILQLIGLDNDGVDDLVAAAFEATGLIQFFTTGVEETRSWNIVKGTDAQHAAAAIHSDISDNFITAEIIQWKTLVENQGWAHCKNLGLIHNEGKTYGVQDGDVIVFRHGSKKK
jgi:GTP-binding protein YchF